MKKSGLADSPFFTESPSTASAPSENRTTERNSEHTEIRPLFRTEKYSTTLPTKRRTKRYSFEFYEDQLLKMKQLKYQAEMNGERLSLSDIVRVALDDYLSDK